MTEAARPDDDANRAAGRWNAVRAALASRPGEPPLGPVPRTAALPASFAQERLWFLDRLYPGDGAYNLAVACRWCGPLDVEALEQSLAALVSRHEILRTTFHFTDGRLWQRVGLAGAPGLAREGFADAADEAVRRWAAARADQPFDLERGPLLRAVVAALGPADHCLLLVAHHAIFDAWSFELFMRAWCDGYGALRRGTALPEPPPDLQYGDFAVWERRRLETARDGRLAYWTRQLAGELPALGLPTDRPRRPGASGPAGAATMIVPPALGQALRALAAREGVTLNVILLGAFYVLLHRHGGDEDVIVGAPVANRSRAGLEQMLGLFTNTLPLRTSLAGEPTFRQLMARVHDTVTAALAHQEVPFELLVKAIAARRDATVPLFRAMFAFQNVPRSGWSWPGLETSAWNVPAARAKLDLVLTMQELRDSDGPAGITGLLEYDAALFEAATAARLLRHLSTLLEGIAATPDCAIAALPILQADERRQVLTAWNDTSTSVPGDPAGIHQIFEARARDRPRATALVSGGQAVSYEALDRRANGLAHRLVARGIGPGTLVAVSLARSPELIGALLAILKAGAAYLPIDRATPRLRAAQLLRHAAAVVTDSGGVDLAIETRLTTVLIDDPTLDDERQIQLDGSCPPDRPAYVMFTSGSTGAPRGVRIPHRGVTRLVRGATYAHFGADEVFLQLAPAAFDASTFEIWGALLNGATLVLAPPERSSLEAIAAMITRHGVTTLWLTAGLFERFVDAGLAPLAPLRQVVTGGDVVSPPHAARFLRETGGRCRLINGYGPTENTTFSTTHPITHVDPEGSVPIGRPIANSRVYVLDGRLQPVPIGAVGEAYLAGDGLALGYLDDEAATRDRFIRVPELAGAPQSLYRTGDRMRWRADGTLEFLGRSDDQAKIRGFRVEPTEVEGVLVAAPGVRAAAVRVTGTGAGDKRLIAYVVPAADADPEPACLADALRDYLSARLPAHAVPADVVFVPELPVTASGKRDRAALPLPPPRPAGAWAPPRDDLEATLSGVFAAVLRTNALGVHDDFFARGGDSLSALAAGAAIERALGRPFPLSTLFQKPTVAGLAEALRDGRPPSASPTAPFADAPLPPHMVAIKPGRSAAPLFLVPGGHGGHAELMVCARLVSRLGPDESVYGFVAPPGLDTVEDIARTHLANLRRLQPRGPYRVGGECIGGTVAYEMAQQLDRAGEQVALLLLLDAWCPTTAGVIHHNLIGQPLALARAGLAFLAEVPHRDPAAEPWLRELWRRAVAPPEAKRLMRACLRYRPVPYRGAVTLFASDQNLRRGIAGAWARLAGGGVTAHGTPGDHESYAKRHHREAAERLRRCLEVPGTVTRKEPA